MAGKNDLSTTELLLLQSELRSSEKSLGVAYMMLFGGHLGLHRFYLNRKVSAAVQLILFILCIVSYILMYGLTVVHLEAGAVAAMAVFFGMALALTVWVIVDACLIPGMVRRWNQAAEEDLIGQIIAHRKYAGSSVPNDNSLS